MEYRLLCADMARAMAGNPDYAELVKRWESMVAVAIRADNQYN